jgi:hypothetical protein
MFEYLDDFDRPDKIGMLDDLNDEYGFIWSTMDGTHLRIYQMETSHIFNCAKLLYNHLADAYGLPTVWFKKRYADFAERAREIPDRELYSMLCFIKEIEKRKNLPEKYHKPYMDILANINRATGGKIHLVEATK